MGKKGQLRSIFFYQHISLKQYNKDAQSYFVSNKLNLEF